MTTSVIGYPRVGSLRELKFATERYFKNEIDFMALEEVSQEIKNKQWQLQKEKGIAYIPSNDFSYYDNVLDVANLFNIVPKRYLDLGLSEIDTYFAQARGYQGEKGDVKALAMKKWFNTNYHYMVPEFEDDTEIKLVGNKPFKEYEAAKALGVETKPVLVGPFTLLKLIRFTGKKQIGDVVDAITKAYQALVKEFNALGVTWLAFDEGYLVYDLTKEDIALFKKIYEALLGEKGNLKVLLQTYFGDVRDVYETLVSLDFDGIGLDFIEGKESLALVEKYGFPKDKLLFAGLVNGKNIWRNDYKKSLSLVKTLKDKGIEVVLSTSCSLLHVPYTLDNETKLDKKYTNHFAFAKEKLDELQALAHLSEANYESETLYKENQALFANRPDVEDKGVQERVKGIKAEDFERLPEASERLRRQQERFNLPLFPTTTIGSFPQTKEVKANRSAFKVGEIDKASYESFNRDEIARWVNIQEEIGLDVLVHGEFERNDMVEYFGEHLEGYLFTEKAWVQSYGTRCVKPPVIWGDVKRKEAITVEWSAYAQSLTKKLMKGMLTGPVTILNWSFPREDISLKESVYQLAFAIRDEVLDLEKAGIQIIQIDEAALREKLPLRKSDWQKDYLDWAISAFRLVHSGVAPETQIHTHMCYSEFTDIIGAIDDMDADVITFEASRSDLLLLDALKENNFKTAVGPGVYDIHSPRVPSVEEIKLALDKMLAKLELEKLWVNPDCGLKTRGEAETVASLKNLVAAAEVLRNENSRTV